MWTGHANCCNKFNRFNTTNQPPPTGTRSPNGTQNNPPAQHIISAPVTTVSSTQEPKLPKPANGEGVKNSRKQENAPTSTAPDGRLCFQCKQQGHLKKDFKSLLIALNAKLEATLWPSVIPKDKTSDNQMKDTKAPTKNKTKDAKITGKTGRKHKINPNSLTKTTDVSTMQLTTGLMIVQQDNNQKHPLLAILLMVQVFIKATNNFKIFLPSSIHNKASLLLAYQPLL